MTMTPAAGWYHDPSDSDAWRWWDGGTWTDHVRPKVETAPVVVAAPVLQAVPQVVATPAPQPIPQVAAAPVPQSVAAPVAQPVAVPVPQPAAAPAPQLVATPRGQFGVAPTAPIGSQPAAPRPTFKTPVLWPEVGSPQTAGVWLLAALPLLSIALQVGVGFALGVLEVATGIVVPLPDFVFLVILLISAWIFAGADATTLRKRGYKPPSIGWMLLLPPLAYLIARGKAVRREGKRAWPPELFYFLSVFIIAGLSVAFVVLFAAMNGGVDGLTALVV